MELKCICTKDNDYKTEYQLFINNKRMKGFNSTAELLMKLTLNSPEDYKEELFNLVFISSLNNKEEISQFPEK